MYITGIGRTKFGLLNKSLPELLYEAMFKTLQDSSLEIEDIDAVVVANFLAGPTQNQLHLGSLVSSLLPGTNLPAFRVEAACASGGMAVFTALSMQHDFENILVLGGEKLNGQMNKKIYKNIAMAGDALRDQQEGLIFPAQYALVAAKYFKRYGASQEDLSLVSLKNYSNAARNPLAHFNYKDLTLEAIRNSPVVCSPLRLFDCCPISDGAAGLIVSRERWSKRDIEIIGRGVGTDAISISQRKEFTGFQAARCAAGLAYGMAKVSPQEIDVAEVHDCFSIAEMIAMEDLGFSGRGKAAEMIRSGEASLSGLLPVNTDGGLLADGHPVGATGIAQICEIVTQLRGEAGKRQVCSPKIGLAHNVGGVGGTAVVHIMRRCS
jgi:acetyl-CoA C-acetyltransferase